MTKQYSAEYFREQGALGGKAAHAQRTPKQRKEFMRTIRAARRPITEANYDKLKARLALHRARVASLQDRLLLATGAKKTNVARLMKNATKRWRVVEALYAEKTKALVAWVGL